MLFLQPAPPAEITRQIFGRDAIEAAKPLLEPGGIGIDILDVQHALVHMLALAGDDQLIFNAFGLGDKAINALSRSSLMSLMGGCSSQGSD